MPCIYCTTRRLTEKERRNFFLYRRGQFDTTMCFHVQDREAVLEFLNCLPKTDRNYLAYLLNQHFGEYIEYIE